MDIGRKRVGILGGAGVAAVNLLLHHLEEYCIQHGAQGDYEQPEFILYSATKTPSRSLFLEGKGESFIPDYIRIAQELERAGATILAISCNTAHYAIDEIKNAITIPCINLVEAVCHEIHHRQYKQIVLLASEGCLQGKVYERYLSNICPELEIIYPERAIQKKITEGIWNTKNQYRLAPLDSPHRPRKIFSDVFDIYKDYEGIVIGCTDICVDFTPPPKYSHKVINSHTILLHSILASLQ